MAPALRSQALQGAHHGQACHHGSSHLGLDRPAAAGAANIVVTRDSSFVADGAAVVGSVAEAIALGRLEARRLGVDDVCIIGGGEIYRQTIDDADLIHVTEVGADIDGDTRFPEIDPDRFVRSFQEILPQGEKDSHPMRFVTYSRRS